MAELAGVLGVTHNPLLWSLLRSGSGADLAPVESHLSRLRERLEALAPEVIVLVASDHLHMLVTSTMPAFMVGKAESMRAVHPNEVRTFGLPAFEVAGHHPLASHLLGGASLDPGFDFAFSDEPWLDHAFAVPLLFLTPQLDIPVVPVFTNANSPPLPTAVRFATLGSYLRQRILDWPGNDRVMVMASGHLAAELGGPRQFLGESPDPDFDREALAWMAEGDLDGAVSGCSLDRLGSAGNETYQFLNFVTCLAAAGGRPAGLAAGVPTRFGNLPFFAWEEV